MFGKTSSIAALATRQTMILKRLLARSLVATLAMALAVVPVVKQKPGSPASPVTQQHRSKQTTGNLLFDAKVPTWAC